ncbi:cytochrome P450 [Boletus coccyginus]|nr:cytochrome P450 [Boletus coccyginus]
MYDRTTTGTLALGLTSYPLPPGPPSLPWIGNVIGVNTSVPWVMYAEWARTYANIRASDLVYSRLLGKDIIIINSEKIAKDLLGDRSRNYSDRPYLITHDMCGLGFSTVFMSYGDRWRHHRRFFHQAFRLESVSRFLHYQHRRACHLLRRLLDSPEQLDDHVFEYTASVILNSTYDYDPVSRKDDLVDIVANTLNIIVPAMCPDIAVIVDAFPLLLRLPSWLPGMSFKREMATASALSKQYLERPFEYAFLKAAMIISITYLMHALNNHSASRMEAISSKGLLMEVLKEAAGSVLMTFFLMMMTQIDAVVGNDRLPTTDDRPLLPFIDAILRETHRYSPVVPLSVPHAAVDDDVYEGFHVPKGAILLANLWSMTHDESRFPNPHAFIPERFLSDDGSLKPNDIEHIVFGFGRRICVGRHSRTRPVLAMFKISKPLDENEAEISVEPAFSSGLAMRVIHDRHFDPDLSLRRRPLPFKCRIVPRLPGMNAEKLEQLVAASTA